MSKELIVSLKQLGKVKYARESNRLSVLSCDCTLRVCRLVCRNVPRWESGTIVATNERKRTDQPECSCDWSTGDNMHERYRTLHRASRRSKCPWMAHAHTRMPNVLTLTYICSLSPTNQVPPVGLRRLAVRQAPWALRRRWQHRSGGIRETRKRQGNLVNERGAVPAISGSFAPVGAVVGGVVGGVIGGLVGHYLGEAAGDVTNNRIVDPLNGV